MNDDNRICLVLPRLKEQGYAMAAATFGTGPKSNEAVYMAYNEESKLWAVANVTAYQQKADSGVVTIHRYDKPFAHPERQKAALEFVTRSALLLAGYESGPV